MLYSGTRRDFFLISTTGLILTLASLGIYRFWTKAWTRRFLWAHLRFAGSPFTYTGSGQELFLGFLKMLALVLFPALAISEAVEFASARASSIGLLATLAVVSLIAPFFARRYRLSRTRWRGLRFAQHGSGWVYLRKALLNALLTWVTLGFYAPYGAMRLLDFQINRLSFGNRFFRYDAAGRRQFVERYLRAWGIALALWALTFAATVGAVVSVLRDPALSNGIARARLEPLIGALNIVAFYLIYFWLRTAYAAALYTHIAQATRFGGIEFRFKTSTWRLLKLRAGNFFIRLLSLWLLSPLATHRGAEFLARSLYWRGAVNFAAIGSGAQLADQSGEGIASLAEADSPFGFDSIGL